MKVKFLAAMGLAAALYSCDDQTTGIGQFVADGDKIEAFAETYPVKTETKALESVYSRSSTAYLGKFTDKSFGELKAGFLAQINCPEGYKFPPRLEAIDTITLEFYYHNYFGDSLASLRVKVKELEEPFEDDGTHKDWYYTNYDFSQWKYKDQLLGIKDYSAYDKTISDSIHNTSDYYPNVTIQLNNDFVRRVSEKAKEQQREDENGNIIGEDFFKDAQTFINHVLPGFYAEVTNGDGSIVYIEDIWMRMQAKYWIKNKVGDADSLATTYIPFAASKEVFMSTNFSNGDFTEQEQDPKGTYLKTPAGLCTAMTLPLQKIYESEHYQDTLNAVSISLPKYKSDSESKYKMGTPKYLLLIQETEMIDFFEQNKTIDNKTSFLASYDSKTNSYSFTKLNRLISKIFSEIKPEEQDNINWGELEEKHKVLLIPVNISLDSQNNIIGVEHDLSVSSARLIKGTGNLDEIKMNVIYTRPKIH